ncbi:MAG: poly-beta-1,6-N-acetyl-D-glucosamine synthase [Gammaproteobacteria bacterium]
MIESLAQFHAGILDFLYYYPLFMAYLWMIGGLYYYYHWEVGKLHHVNDLPLLRVYPAVSIIVPCYNEGRNVVDTITYLDQQKYPDFEIIAINDGSSDETGRLLDQICDRFPRLRVIHLENNQGKAMALRMGALMSPNEFLVCIDGDALLDEHATTWIMSHFVSSSRVAAVTGNPRIRTRSTLLGKLQVGEFSSVIGLIKRAQRIYGRIFTVSGVVSGFRKRALHQAGYWDLNMVTDDIDISWKLQLDHWDIRYEPNALCWILMPETLSGLWRQRLRWAQGGMEALIKYGGQTLSWRKRRMWGVVLEFFTSVIWAYAMALVILLWLVSAFVSLPENFAIDPTIVGWSGVILGMTCLLQFGISLVIDSRYERGISKYYYWMIWYPIAYWMINITTTVVAVPKAMIANRRYRATWTSPDRGLRP